MKKLSLSLFSVLLLLNACSTAGIAEQKYPNRQRISFSSPSVRTEYVYLCKKSATEAETQARAAAAHQFLKKRLKEVTTEAFAKMLKSKNSSIFSAMRASSSMNRGAGVVAKEVEEKFQCMLIEAND